jgi:hypothetical protein
MTASAHPVSNRSTTLVKYAFLLVAYAVTLAIICGTLVNLLVDNFHVHFPRVNFTLANLLAPLLGPNTIAVAVTAWLLRRRWADLRASQLLVPAVGMAIATPIVSLILLAAAQALFHFDQLSVGAWAVTWRLAGVTTGVLVAQLLRLRRKTSTLSYV